MDAQEAIEIVSQMTYMPGWTLRAEPAWLETDRELWVTVTYDAPDSRVEYAPAYPYTIRPMTGFYVEPDAARTVDDIARQVADGLMGIHEHEMREFLRIRSEGYRAPFHPHQEAGRRAWVATGKQMAAAAFARLTRLTLA